MFKFVYIYIYIYIYQLATVATHSTVGEWKKTNSAYTATHPNIK